MRGWLGTLTALPMSWQSDGDDQLVVGAGALGERGGLQAVRELVDREPVDHPSRLRSMPEHPVGDAVPVRHGLTGDDPPLLGGGLGPSW